MAFRGREITGNYYSVLDAYDASKQIFRLKEKAGTKQRQYRLETIENEFRQGFINKADWYEKRVVDLQRLFSEETDPYQSLKIQNDMMRLTESKANWIEAQDKREESLAKRAESYRKKLINSNYTQMKYEFSLQDREYGTQLQQVENSGLPEADKTLLYYELYEDYFGNLSERREHEAIVAKAGLDLDAGTNAAEKYVFSIDDKLQKWTEEGSMTIGGTKIEGRPLAEIKDQLRHIEGAKENPDGTFDVSDFYREDTPLVSYVDSGKAAEGDGTYVPVFQDGKWDYIKNDTVKEDFVKGPDPRGGDAFYRKAKESKDFYDQVTGEKETKEGEFEYIETVSPEGVPVRVLIKDGEVDWGHAYRDIPFDEKQRGAWALGYDDVEDMKNIKVNTPDGKEKRRYYTDEDLLVAAKDVTSAVMGFSGTPFDGKAFQDPIDGRVYLIQNGRKKKIDDMQELTDAGINNEDILEDTEGVLDDYMENISDETMQETGEFNKFLDEDPSRIPDDVYRFKKADGGFDFFETRGGEQNPITAQEYAQRKNIPLPEALGGSENPADQATAESLFEESFLNVGQEPKRPTFGAPKRRGVRF